MGPLPAVTAVVVQCIYCEASNVTGVDLRANARRAAKSAHSLWNALEQRLRDRRTWRWRTLASLPFFVVVPLVVRDAFKAGEERWTFESLDAPGYEPHLSFDGKKVLYDNSGWRVLDLATKKTVPAGIDHTARCAIWLPDGRIAFLADDTVRTSKGDVLVTKVDGANALVVSRDGSSIAVVGSGTIIYPIGRGKERHVESDDADFGPDGNMLGRDTEGIAFFLADGTRKHVTDTGTSARVSPDGKRIVFFEEGELKIMSNAGWKKKTLMKDCPNCKDLRWESDGNVYFVRDAGLWRGRP